MSLLALENLRYKYAESNNYVLDDINFSFVNGKIYSIVGKSGAGKTTLLSLLSGLTDPSSGRILLDGKDISKIDKYKYRSQYVGVVFQSFNLLPHLTALENVILSMDISGKKYDDKKGTAMELLKKVDLSEEEANRRVLKLSGGQQQRVAVARVLSYDPQIILADEPTGILDRETQDEIMRIFKMLANEGKCIILVTHSPIVAESSDVTYVLTKPLKVSKKKVEKVVEKTVEKPN